MNTLMLCCGLNAMGKYYCHVILNLPGDTELDVIETAKIISVLGVDFVKLHSLYVVGGTELGRRYETGAFTMISLQEYVERWSHFWSILTLKLSSRDWIGKGPQDNLCSVTGTQVGGKLKTQLMQSLLHGIQNRGVNLLSEWKSTQTEKQPK